jgi:RHS repeat-associated protein
VPDASQEKQASRGPFSSPSISLPNGGGAIRGIGEKFSANPATGTGSLSIPIAISPGRSGFGPQLALDYDSGSGNGPFGLGWTLALPAITRKTDKGLPLYRDEEESDVFILSGAEDLVPVPTPTGVPDPPGFTVKRYRPRVEGLFARIERWTEDLTGVIHWRSISRDNITTVYGETENSRIFDPADRGTGRPPRIFSWLICQSYDDKGNAITYEYVSEDSRNVDVAQAHERNRTERGREANRYVKRVKYGNTISRLLPTFANTDWLFEVVFDYGEGHLTKEPIGADKRETVHASLDGTSSWPVRQDPFSTYRAGFEVRTYRLCQRVLMFHHFPDQLGIDDYLVRATHFDYDRGPVASFLTSVTQSGYVAWPDPTNPTDLFLQRSLPAVEFEYSKAVLSQEVRELTAGSLENLPSGVDGGRYQWVDLDGEGVSGIMTEQADSWFYKRNLGAGSFGSLEPVAKLPSVGMLGGTTQQLLDIAGDGQLDLAEFAGDAPGFYERNDQEGWEAFSPFSSLPRINWAGPNVRFVDLTGDGLIDVLIAEDPGLVWHRSLGEAGFAPGERCSLERGEEQSLGLVLADGSQSVYLADLSGDGLADLVRVRNGEVSYWPNLGYGRFGARVTMDGSPVFDRPDQFDQRQIRLADIDGSGTTDIIYLRRGEATVYRNLSGNGWGTPESLSAFPVVDDLSAVLATDLLGSGTTCLVWSSSLPGNARRPMRYMDLMAAGKPHLLIGMRNNLGADIRVRYAPSTKFYLADRAAGKPWVTRLPFPVHVVERVETWDRISRNRLVSTYTYHHGYFDGVEREFRGFGLVEQLDSEEIAALVGEEELGPAANADPSSHVPPVLARTWFHTGVYLGPERVSNYFAGLLDNRDIGEYYREPAWRSDDDEARKRLLEDTLLPFGLTADEEREACRALKGAMLRREIYALDAPGTDGYPFGQPYTVTEQNFAIKVVQRQGDRRHAIFLTHPDEVIDYHYEREPTDPRIAHTLTLEVDPWGNVLKSASVAYGRLTDDPELDPEEQEIQGRTLVTFTEDRYTNDLDTSAAYRAPAAAESCTYQLTGYPPTGSAGRFRPSDFVQPDPNDSTRLVHIFDAELGYHESPTGGKERRPVERTRTYYRPDDLGVSQGDPLALLGLTQMQSLGLPGETLKLALTAPPAQQAYVDSGKLTQTELDGMLGGDAGYVHSEGDADWWIPAGRVFYSPGTNDSAATERTEARAHFFLPRRYRDPFHTAAIKTETVADYDDYDLLLQQTSDALGNRFTAGERATGGGLAVQGNDYRVLQPQLIMDPNRNRVAVAFDALGLVVGTAIQGKPLPATGQGDSLDSFEADLDDATALGHLADPLASPEALLGRATTRLVYDLFAYLRDQMPAVVYSMARETHDSEPVPVGGLRIQHRLSYSDGFGREVQKKVLVEPGPTPQRDAAGAILLGTDGLPLMTPNDVTPRWLGSGWTVFNNKGNPVLQYEPFFTDTHVFEFAVRVGVSPLLFYDPLQRVVVTLHPNHAYEKVVFSTWDQAIFDVNDTVRLDPRTDPDTRVMKRYFASQPAGWTTWLQQRIDPLNPPVDSNGQHPEQDVAVRAMLSGNTPERQWFDPLGRLFLTVADNGIDAANAPQRYRTRRVLDVEGNERAIVDPLGREAMRHDYDLLSTWITQASIDAGRRWQLNDVTGKRIRLWDSRGNEVHITYDALRRPIKTVLRHAPGSSELVSRTVYGEGHPQNETLNLRGKVFLQLDGAGSIINVGQNPVTGAAEAYDFKGNRLHTSRRLARAYRQTSNWSTASPALNAAVLDPAAIETALSPLLEPEVFRSNTTYDALNRPATLTTPDASFARLGYDKAALLKQVDVALRGAATTTSFVGDIHYNAKGQRTLISYGNGVTTSYEYDRLTFRLTTLTTTRTGFPANQRTVQALTHTWDPVGNLTHVRDDADTQNVVFFDNRRVEPACDYRYDPIYRLILASGREQLGLTADQPNPPRQADHDDSFRMGLPHPSDGNAVGRYREEYAYDEVGNILTLVHRGTDPQHPGWTRTYVYDGDLAAVPQRKNNRLVRTQPAGPNEGTNTDYTYDPHGNMTTMPHLPLMRWDHKDQLQATSQQVVSAGTPEITYYTYDAAGLRVRKVTEGATAAGVTPSRIKERVYLDGWEVYREYDPAGAVTLERETLHVMDDRRRIAMVDTRTIPTTVVANDPMQLVRYQIGNHLGSVGLELDEAARIISYEEFYPYGGTSYQAVRKTIQVPLKRYRYTGQERDAENGLNYHGARYYACWLGRWTSPDPAGVTAGLNLYEYGFDNPLLFRDIGGLQPSRGTLTKVQTNRTSLADAGTGATAKSRSTSVGDAGTNERRDAGTVSQPADAGQVADTRKPISLLLYHVAKPGVGEAEHIAKEPKTGRWTRTAHIADFADALATIEELSKTHRIVDLGLLVHGDSPGEFVIGPDKVTATTLPTESLKKIQALLDPNAKLLLFGCISGAEAPGTKLLIGISKLLPGHDVVGFDAQNTPELPLGTLQREGGFFSSKQVFDPFVKTFRPFKTDHGWIQFRTESDVNGFMHQFPALFDKANLKVDATETAETAKVARDGKVIRWPIDEAPPAVPTEQKKRK